MSLLVSGIYLLVIALVGYMFVSLLLGPRRLHWAEALGFSFAGGAGACGFFFFACSLAGIAPNRTILAAIAVIAVVGTVILWRRQRLLSSLLPEPLPRSWDSSEIIGAIAALLILLACINTAICVFTPGIADIDAYGIWMFKAKMLATEPLRPVPAALKAPSLSFSHQDYPFGFPLLVAGAYAAVGKIDEQSGKLILAPIFLSFVAVIYGALRRMLRRSDSIVLTALLAAAPIVREQTAMAVAEMLLVLFYTCCLVLLWHWMKKGNRRDLLAAGAFAAFAALAKNEGLALLPMVGIVALLFAIAHRSRKLLIDWLAAALVALFVIAPWLVYRHQLPSTQEDYGGKLLSLSTLVSDLPRLWRVLPRFAILLIQFKEAGAIWLVLAVLAILGYGALGRLPVLFLWLLLIAHLALYLLTFMVSPWQPEGLIPMVGPKLLLHIMPVATLLIAEHLARLRDLSQ